MDIGRQAPAAGRNGGSAGAPPTSPRLRRRGLALVLVSATVLPAGGCHASLRPAMAADEEGGNEEAEKGPDGASESTGVPEGRAPRGEPGETAGGGADDATGGTTTPAESRREPPPDTQKPTTAVRQAVRSYLSRDRVREKRGLAALKRGGLQVVPQLRYWLHRVHFEARRVEALIDEILRENGREPSAERAASRNMTVGDFFHRKLLEARKLAREGDYRKAREIAEALVALDRNSPIAWELRRLIREASERAMAQELEPRIDVDSLVYEVGEKPEITFRLINRSRETAHVTMEEGILGELTVAITMVSIDGGERRDKKAVILRAGRRRQELTLQPGQIWMQDVTLKDFMSSIPIAGVVARVHIAGKFRPSLWGFEGEEEGNLAVRIAPCEFWIVPPGQKKGLGAPHKRLVAALFFGKREGFLIGGQLGVWAGEKDPVLNEKLVETLVEHLEQLDAGRLRLAMSFLRQATGRGFKEVQDWKTWWTLFSSAKGRPPAVMGTHRPERK